MTEHPSIRSNGISGCLAEFNFLPLMPIHGSITPKMMPKRTSQNISMNPPTIAKIKTVRC
jgi:hypothetical protein